MRLVKKNTGRGEKSGKVAAKTESCNSGLRNFKADTLVCNRRLCYYMSTIGREKAKTVCPHEIPSNEERGTCDDPCG